MNETNENAYLILANDCKLRFEVKNKKISELSKLIFVLYGLIRRGLETDEQALFIEARSVISEYFEETYDIE